MASGKIAYVIPIIKAKLGLLALITSFYFGAQHHHLVDRIEHNLFRRHLSYAAQSHRGSLSVINYENSQGQLEKKLKNDETGELMYTLRPDCLPDNDFIYHGLEQRMELASPDDLGRMYAQARMLSGRVKERLFAGIPVSPGSIDPSQLDLPLQVNEDGQIIAAPKYGDRIFQLSQENIACLEQGSSIHAQNNETQAMQPAIAQPVEPQIAVKETQQGSAGTIIYAAAILGIIGAGIAYLRKKYPR